MRDAAMGIGRWFEARPGARWIALLPGVFLAVIVVQFPLHWFLVLMTSFRNDDSPLSIWNLPLRRLEQFGVALVVPATAVYCAGYIAPIRRFVAAVVAAVLLAALLFTIYGYALGASWHMPDPLWLTLLPLVFNGLGIWWGLNEAKKLPEPASPRRDGRQKDFGGTT